MLNVKTLISSVSFGLSTVNKILALSKLIPDVADSMIRVFGKFISKMRNIVSTLDKLMNGAYYYFDNKDLIMRQGSRYLGLSDNHPKSGLTVNSAILAIVVIFVVLKCLLKDWFSPLFSVGSSAFLIYIRGASAERIIGLTDSILGMWSFEPIKKRIQQNPTACKAVLFIQAGRILMGGGRLIARVV